MLEPGSPFFVRSEIKFCEDMLTVEVDCTSQALLPNSSHSPSSQKQPTAQLAVKQTLKIGTIIIRLWFSNDMFRHTKEGCAQMKPLFILPILTRVTVLFRSASANLSSCVRYLCGV